ncbi:LRR_1 domain-containing protein/LRRNT_2 domain-containing protein/LRR_4 domain-containing protein, partial [Cephalotus follicularis]
LSSSIHLHFLFLKVVLALTLALVHSSTLESDIQVLQSLKRSIDPISISSSSYLDSWDFSLDPCETTGGKFLGVLCTLPSDNSTTRILELDLDGIGYDGFLTPSIGNLMELTILNLSKNKFRGPIPDSIVKLVKLTRLSLSENYFTASIPAGISNLQWLETIDLSHNKLSGSIPDKIVGLRRLTALSLSSNGLSGRIPDLMGMWHLNTLDLDTNQLYGNLPKLPVNLRTLSLSHNLLSGHISGLRNLKNLRSLDLSDNRFSGSIGREILMLPQLVFINVSVNRFTAMEMANFAGMDTQLQVLDVQGNSLHGRLPISLVTVQNLLSINLARNQFYGTIPSEYGLRLGNPWRSLFLDYNFLTGSLPPQFNSTRTRIRGSLANNCLHCPMNIPLCRGGQRPALEC